MFTHALAPFASLNFYNAQLSLFMWSYFSKSENENAPCALLKDKYLAYIISPCPKATLFFTNYPPYNSQKFFHTSSPRHSANLCGPYIFLAFNFMQRNYHSVLPVFGQRQCSITHSPQLTQSLPFYTVSSSQTTTSHSLTLSSPPHPLA